MAGSRIPDVVAAAVSALASDATLTTLLGGAKCYTHVPQGTDPPYVLVMGGDEVPFAQTFVFADGSAGDFGDNGGRQCDVLAQCVSTYRGSEQVDALADRVLELLTDDATWATTALADLQAVEFIRNAAFPPADLNGVLWFQRTVVVRASVLP